MNLKEIQKFDKLIQKTTNKKLNTFDEIADMLFNLIKMEVNANQNELMQRVSSSATFNSTEEFQTFLDGYFGFNNTLIVALESLENIDEDSVFDLKIDTFTKNILSVIPKDKLKESMRGFILSLVNIVESEYPITNLISSGESDILGMLSAMFGNEDIAMMYMALTLVSSENKDIDIFCEDIFQQSVSAFVFVMAMNSLRKDNYQNSLSNQVTTQNSANSTNYNVGRNDPCPCGSGRKYKKCCLNKDKPKALEGIQFKEPKDILPALTKDEMHELYIIWSMFLNFVSAAYAAAADEEPILIYGQKANGDYFLTDEAMQTHHYLTIRNFLDEYFFMLVDHFVENTMDELDDDMIAILFDVRDSYKNIDVYSFEMFDNGNAIFYNPVDGTCFYAHKSFYPYSKVFPKAKLIQTMFFSYKGRIITDGIAASPKIEMGENMQNMIKEEYEKARENLVFLLELNEAPKKDIYQLKISIKGAKPPIWRRILVEPNISFSRLHDIIQDIFNWEDYHLYMFSSKKASYTNRETLEEDMFGNIAELAANEFSIKTELKDVKDKILYTYDFGDDWEHSIVLEKILPRDSRVEYPICTGGRREGPMEDCGGIHTYNEIVQAIENPTFDNQHYLGEDGENWYEGFTPSDFDKDEINDILSLDKLA